MMHSKYRDVRYSQMAHCYNLLQDLKFCRTLSQLFRSSEGAVQNKLSITTYHVKVKGSKSVGFG